MSFWLRVLVGFVAIVAAALLLKTVHPVLVLAVFVAGAAYAYTRVRRSRVPERRTGAELLGLKRETEDPFGITGYPLALFSRMRQPSVGELVWGRWRSIDVHVFEVSFESPSLLGDSGGRSTFACAMGRMDAMAPAFVAEPMAFLTLLERPPSMPTLDHDDPALGVWSDDPAAAGELLEEETHGWLRSLDPRWGVEVRGRIAMVYGPRPEQPDIVASLETLRELLARVSAWSALRPPDPGRAASPAAD